MAKLSVNLNAGGTSTSNEFSIIITNEVLFLNQGCNLTVSASNLYLSHPG